MTTRHPDRRYHRSIRLRGYDYTRAGAYFITICSRERACLFADIDGHESVVRLSPVGEIVAQCWVAIPDHFPVAELDAFVIMPNHLHGIVVLETAEGTACRAATAWRRHTGSDGEEESRIERFGAPVAGSIPTIVRSFKAAVTKAINDDLSSGTACRAFLTQRIGSLPLGRIPSLWQSNYHEHIIRNEAALDHLRNYVAANPGRWAEDSLHPEQLFSTLPSRIGPRRS
jgi:putative transposase